MQARTSPPERMQHFTAAISPQQQEEQAGWHDDRHEPSGHFGLEGERQEGEQGQKAERRIHDPLELLSPHTQKASAKPLV